MLEGFVRSAYRVSLRIKLFLYIMYYNVPNIGKTHSFLWLNALNTLEKASRQVVHNKIITDVNKTVFSEHQIVEHSQ